MKKSLIAFILFAATSLAQAGLAVPIVEIQVRNTWRFSCYNTTVKDCVAMSAEASRAYGQVEIEASDTANRHLVQGKNWQILCQASEKKCKEAANRLNEKVMGPIKK